jgi:protein-S-isoprenylcysteine O-methyltransferase Ste14
MKQKIMPTIYFVLFLLLSVNFHFIFPIRRIIYFPYNLVGIVPVVLGIGINLWTDSIFKKSNTTVKPYEKPTSLEVSGPFRISRHPMYLGMEAILLGDAIILGSIVAFIFPIIFVILIESMFIPLEEKNLESVFGEKYLEYKRRVRRWL